MAVSQNADWSFSDRSSRSLCALKEDCTGRKRNAVLVFADLKQFKCVLIKRAGDGIRTRDIHVGNVVLYH
jgi:hypothetical protein